jgi:hypothetical protein
VDDDAEQHERSQDYSHRSCKLSWSIVTVGLAFLLLVGFHYTQPTLFSHSWYNPLVGTILGLLAGSSIWVFSKVVKYKQVRIVATQIAAVAGAAYIFDRYSRFDDLNFGISGGLGRVIFECLVYVNLLLGILLAKSILSFYLMRDRRWLRFRVRDLFFLTIGIGLLGTFIRLAKSDFGSTPTLHSLCFWSLLTLQATVGALLLLDRPTSWGRIGLYSTASVIAAYLAGPYTMDGRFSFAVLAQSFVLAVVLILPQFDLRAMESDIA